MQNDFGPAEALLAESLALYRELGQPGQWGYARALTFLGEAALFQDDYPRAATLFEESLSFFRELGDRWGMSIALENLGVAAWRQGDREQALTSLEESLTLARELGLKYGIVRALNRLGRIHQITQRRGDHTRSDSLLKESLTLARDMEHRWGMLQSLWGLALASGMRGQPERQARLLGAMETVRKALGYPMPPAEKADYENAVSDSRARLDEAAFAVAWAKGQAMTLEEAIAYALGETPP